MPDSPTPPSGIDLARRLGLVGATSAGGGLLMALAWGVYGRSVGASSQGPAMIASSVSLWWGLFAVIGIAASAAALLVGRESANVADRRLRWGALGISILLLATGRLLGAIPF